MNKQEVKSYLSSRFYNSLKRTRSFLKLYIFYEHDINKTLFITFKIEYTHGNYYF